MKALFLTLLIATAAAVEDLQIDSDDDQPEEHCGDQAAADCIKGRERGFGNEDLCTIAETSVRCLQRVADDCVTDDRALTEATLYLDRVGKAAEEVCKEKDEVKCVLETSEDFDTNYEDCAFPAAMQVAFKDEPNDLSDDDKECLMFIQISQCVGDYVAEKCGDTVADEFFDSLMNEAKESYSSKSDHCNWEDKRKKRNYDIFRQKRDLDPDFEHFRLKRFFDPDHLMVKRFFDPDHLMVKRFFDPDHLMVKRFFDPDHLMVKRFFDPDHLMVKRFFDPDHLMVKRFFDPDHLMVKRDSGPDGAVKRK